MTAMYALRSSTYSRTLGNDDQAMNQEHKNLILSAVRAQQAAGVKIGKYGYNLVKDGDTYKPDPSFDTVCPLACVLMAASPTIGTGYVDSLSRIFGVPESKIREFTNGFDSPKSNSYDPKHCTAWFNAGKEFQKLLLTSE